MDFLIKNKVLFWIIGILIVINILSIGTMWFWKTKGPHPPRFQIEPPKKDGKMFLAEELKLSKQQADEFEKLRDEHFKKINGLQEDIRKLKDDLFPLLSSPDTVKAVDIATRLSEKQKEIEIATFNHFRKLREICSNEQKAKFDIVIKDIWKKMGPQPPGPQINNPPDVPPGPPPGEPPGPPSK